MKRGPRRREPTQFTCSSCTLHMVRIRNALLTPAELEEAKMLAGEASWERE